MTQETPHFTLPPCQDCGQEYVLQDTGAWKDTWICHHLSACRHAQDLIEAQKLLAQPQQEPQK